MIVQLHDLYSADHRRFVWRSVVVVFPRWRERSSTDSVYARSIWRPARDRSAVCVEYPRDIREQQGVRRRRRDKKIIIFAGENLKFRVFARKLIRGTSDLFKMKQLWNR